ncbi:hypothetical protein ACWGTO_32065 [Mesorhizobium sp. PL10]
MFVASTICSMTSTTYVQLASLSSRYLTAKEIGKSSALIGAEIALFIVMPPSSCHEYRSAVAAATQRRETKLVPIWLIEIKNKIVISFQLCSLKKNVSAKQGCVANPT